MRQWLLSKCLDRRVILSVLGVSLGLNIFLAAFFGGTVMGRRFPFLLFAHNRIGEVIGDLPAARQKEIRQRIRDEVVPGLQQALAEQKELDAELSTVMTAPDVTRERLEAVFTRIRVVTSAAQARMQGQFVDIILSLPPTERESLAEGIRRLLRRGDGLR